MNELENYIVERLHKLENEVKEQKAEADKLRNALQEVEAMKAIMREYFVIRSYTDGSHYIDHSYKEKHFAEIADFIGLETREDGEDDV